MFHIDLIRYCSAFRYLTYDMNNTYQSNKSNLLAIMCEQNMTVFVSDVLLSELV